MLHVHHHWMHKENVCIVRDTFYVHPLHDMGEQPGEGRRTPEGVWASARGRSDSRVENFRFLALVPTEI
jgi:hypothetical protein